jgi:hypothetical protein
MKVYDGDNVLDVTKEVIASYSPTKLVEVFEATAVYYDLLSDMSDLIARGIVTDVCDAKVSPAVMQDIKKGVRYLTVELDEKFGTDSAAAIWKRTIDSINAVRV